MKQLSLIILWICSGVTQAQNIFNPVGAESWSLGGTSVISKNVFSVINNPATIGSFKKIQAGIYSEQRFGEAKLNSSNIALILPSKFINIGFSINHFGYELFNQQKFNLSLGKRLSKQFLLGVSISYFETNISEQSHSGNFLGEFGLIYQPFQKWQIGMFVFNPTQSRYSVNSYDRIPTYARFGASYEISDKVQFISEIEQTLNQNLVLRGGIKYQIHEILSLSIGAANNPVYLTFGTGIKLKNYKVDFAMSTHQILGVSPHLSISFPVEK
jgi:hypothetical protein